MSLEKDVNRPSLTGKRLHQARNPVDDVIRGVLEAVRVVMINGTENIPPLDPFYIDNLLVNFTSADAKYVKSVKKLRLSLNTCRKVAVAS